MYNMIYLFFNETANTEIYTNGHTLSLHDALPISQGHALNAEKARRDASIWVKQALGEGSDAARDQGGPRDGQTRRFPAARRCDDRRRPRSRCPRNRTGR